MSPAGYVKATLRGYARHEYRMKKTDSTPDAKNVDRNPAKTTSESESEKLGIGNIIFPLLFVERNISLAYLASSLTFILTLFFLSPLDYYLNNSTEFIIGIGVIILPLILICMVLFLIVVLFPLLIIKGDKLNAISLLLCGLTAALYFQALFLNGEMILLDGGISNYSEWNTAHISNLLIWMAITFLPLYTWNCRRNSKTPKNIKWEKAVICASVVILGMQSAGVIAAAAGYNPGDVKNTRYYLSYDKSFEMSSRENICVFLLDNYDVIYMKETLESYPELYEELDGFTFYENNTSIYKYTNPNTTYLLTGYYTERADEFLKFKEAWERRGFIDIIRENGWSVMLLPSLSSTVQNYERLIGKADNLLLNENPPKLNRKSATKVLLNFSFEKLFPYLLKFYFRTDRFGASFNNYFLDWGFDDSLLPSVSPATDINFYNRLKTTGLNIQSESKTFTFTHFNSAHDGGYRYNAENGEIEKGSDYDRIEAGRGSLAILNEYFTQMKELGIYDDSTIIIMADHGRVPAEAYYGIDSKLTGAITATLIIKPKNARGKLEIDKISELSHKNFSAGVLEFAGLPREDFGLSYFDVINNRIPQKREFFLDRWGSVKWNPKGMYIISGDANDFNNWTFVPDESE